MGSEKDISIPANIALRRKQLEHIDKHRVGKNYKNRSDYIQYLVDKDLYYKRLDLIAELMSMQILPMMSFFFFLVLAVLTKGLLFYIFMIIFGIFAVFLSVAYVLRHKSKKAKKGRG